MSRRIVPFALLVAVAGGALALRLPRLDLRPLHGDEAVEAFRTGRLLAEGYYRYDPHEYHGPTLHYFSLPFLWLSGARSFAESHESTYRLVCVAFGVGAILLLALLADGLGWPATLVAAVLTALSPAMVFYNRYYIHESLLVFFTVAAIGCGWRYVASRRVVWAILTGASLALMHATKETCIFAFAAMGLALLAYSGWRRLWREPAGSSALRTPHSALPLRHVAAAIAAGLAVCVLLFTSFFTNWRGPLDSVLTYVSYLARSGGAGLHRHPWHYYLGLLAYARYGPGIWFSEALILGLAAIGLGVAFLPPRTPHSALRTARPASLIRFVALYTLILTGIYAVVPYKTPWCMMSFLHGMIVLAGVGAAALVGAVPTHLLKGVAALALAAGAWQLGGQAWRASLDRRWVADRRNPYVYAHTAPDLLKVAQRAEQIAEVHPRGRELIIKIVAPDHDYWPLPFYLRRFPNTGYWPRHDPGTGQLVEMVPSEPDADIVICSVGATEELESRLRDSYFRETRGLRPAVHIVVYTRRELWDAFIARQSQPAAP